MEIYLCEIIKNIFISQDINQNKYGLKFKQLMKIWINLNKFVSDFMNRRKKVSDKKIIFYLLGDDWNNLKTTNKILLYQKLSIKL